MQNLPAKFINTKKFVPAKNFFFIMEMTSHGIALAELIAYIDEARTDDNVAPVFKLADLVRLYSTRLELKQRDHPHSTRLKNRIFLPISQTLQLTKKGVIYFLLLTRI